MNSPIIVKNRQDVTSISSSDTEQTGNKPVPEADKVLDIIYGRKSLDRSKDQSDVAEDEKKSDGSDGQISQQSIANILASQQVIAAKSVENKAEEKKISTLRSLDFSTVTLNPQALLQARNQVAASTQDKEKSIDDIDDDTATSAFGSDSGDSKGGANFTLEPLLSTQAAIHQLHQQKNPDEEQQGKGKGLLAELVEQLVDCLHVSERMRSDDWQIIIKLKSEILHGAQLHLENYGRKLSVKLIAGDKETFDMLMQERYDLQNVLRNSLDQDINVTMERV